MSLLNVNFTKEVVATLELLNSMTPLNWFFVQSCSCGTCDNTHGDEERFLASLYDCDTSEPDELYNYNTNNTTRDETYGLATKRDMLFMRAAKYMDVNGDCIWHVGLETVTDIIEDEGKSESTSYAAYASIVLAKNRDLMQALSDARKQILRWIFVDENLFRALELKTPYDRDQTDE